MGQEKKEKLPVDEHEHIVDIEAPEIKAEIEKAREVFESFFERHGENFDLANPEKIEAALKAAEAEGIFDKAQNIRELIYGKNISIYGVSYLSNKCDQCCSYCPMGQAALAERWQKEILEVVHQKRRKKIASQWQEAKKLFEDGKISLDNLALIKSSIIGQGEMEKRWTDIEKKSFRVDELANKTKYLDPEQYSSDLDALRQLGHQEICLLASEELYHEPGEGVRSTQEPDQVIKYAQIALDKPGVREIILNMVSYSENAFRYVIEGLKVPADVKIQHRVFQETYDRKKYAQYHKNSPEGGKKDFDRRYDSQVAALKAGFDEVGIGALFGLSQFPLKEIEGLRDHANYIKKGGGKEPKRCCLPLANEPKGSELEIDFKIPGMVNAEKITELIYALSRLAMPTVSIVSSERDGPEVLKVLDKYANHTTLFVHPWPGGNVDALKDIEAVTENADVISQAKTFSRQPQQAIADWQERGYNVLGFDYQKYGK